MLDCRDNDVPFRVCPRSSEHLFQSPCDSEGRGPSVSLEPMRQINEQMPVEGVCFLVPWLTGSLGILEKCELFCKNF